MPLRTDPGEFLEAAAGLARRIAESAVWSGGRCNWVGATGGEESRRSGHAVMEALGPDVYEGTSGVALFLAEAACRLDEPRFRATALGAIRHALGHSGRAGGDGLYSGRPGIGWAAARVAALLGADDVAAGAERLRNLRRPGARRWTADVMRGRAGTVIALVALGETGAAAVAGDELIAHAERGPAGWSWGDPEHAAMKNLCGYAHGASGVGHALAELFGASGDDRYRDAAERAFEYESSWLDPHTGAWPDLRGVGRRAGREVPLVPAAETWCNGAGGIALARLRSHSLLGNPELRHDADVALAACERHVAGLLERAPVDFSLCHGAAGTADVLLESDRVDLAAQVGRLGLQRHGRPGAPAFPCGVTWGETPTLMQGLAGVGMFYLRLADRGVPSPLLVGLTEHSEDCESRGTRRRSEA